MQNEQIQNQELYQCEECGFQYAGKEWAEKCEAWCKEHQSCNIEITAHAIPQDDTSKKDELNPVRSQTPEASADARADRTSNGVKPEDIKFLTKLFYGLISITSSLAFFLILYWVLRLDSAITNIITNTYGTPLYFWPYVILTLGAIALFGVNVSLLVYRWRKFGPPKLKTEAGGGAGTLFGIAASACPVCGSTLLSAIGIAGGLAAFPLQGLELKALSFAFMALPIWLVQRDLKKLECGDGACPMPKDHRFKESDRPWLWGLLAAVIVLALVNWNWLKTEPIFAKALAQNRILNPNDNTLSNADISADISETGNELIDEITANVLLGREFQSKVVLGDSVVNLVQNGVMDRDRSHAKNTPAQGEGTQPLAPK